MLTLEQISNICSGMAWASGVTPYKSDTPFEVNVVLPFPFYEALQRELTQLMTTMPVIGDVDKTKPMRITKLNFPTGIQANIIEGDDKIIFEVAKPGAKVIDMHSDNGFLKPAA